MRARGEPCLTRNRYTLTRARELNGTNPGRSIRAQVENLKRAEGDVLFLSLSKESFLMCYEYDWMQEATQTEEARSISESADNLVKPIEAAPPSVAEPAAEEAVPA